MKNPLSTSSFLDDLTDWLRSGGLYPHGSDALEWLMLAGGDPNPYSNIILFGFEPGNHDPTFVVKVPRMPQNGNTAELEYRRLADIWALLGPAAEACLPKPLAYITLHGQPAMAMSYVRGKSLVRSSRRRFWAEDALVLKFVIEAGASVRRLNDLAAVPLAPAENPHLDLGRRATRFADLFPLTQAETAALEMILQEAISETSRATHKVLIQGDFWHGNVIRRFEGPDLVFLDWQFAHWSSDVSADVYLFLLAAALAAAPYGSPLERARGAADVLLKWRLRIIPAYLTAYGKPDGYAVLPARSGMLATCVEKAVRSEQDLAHRSPDDLTWRLLFAELVKWPDTNWSQQTVVKDA